MQRKRGSLWVGEIRQDFLKGLGSWCASQGVMFYEIFLWQESGVMREHFGNSLLRLKSQPSPFPAV